MNDTHTKTEPKTLTDRAKAAMSFAAAEMHMLFHDQIDAETILLGIIKSANKRSDGLENFGIRVMNGWNGTPEKIAAMIYENLPALAPKLPADTISYTERARKVIEHAIVTAHELGNSDVDTVHLLLGVIAATGLGSVVLSDFGINADKVHSRIRLLQARPC